MTHALIVESFPAGPLQCNCTIIGDPKTGEALVVDPGGDAEHILERLSANQLKVASIFHTHAHFDHFMASGAMKRSTGAMLALHKADKPLWDNLETQCARFGFDFDPEMPPPDRWLEHEEEIKLQGTEALKGTCIHTPGHTPGSMCFHFDALQLLLGGDTLFRGSIGRTDLWGGDYATIEESIKNRLYVLDEETRVITGHGPETMIGYEMRHNAHIHA